MDFFFVLFIIGLVVLTAVRMNRLTKEVATVHCIKHQWRLNENKEMYCAICKGKPE